MPNQRETMVMRGRILVGIVIVGIGATLLLDNLGLINGFSAWKFIPSLAVIVMLYHLIARRFSRATGPLIVIGIAASFQLFLLGFISWPVIVIAVGLAILLSGLWYGKQRGGRVRSSTIDENHVNVTALIGGAAERNHSQNFLGGRITAFMGGIELDLKEADVIDKPARLDVNVMLGGAEIRVPDHSVVKKDAQAIMGGIDEAREAVESPDPTDPLGDMPDMVVSGSVVLGGLSITR